MSDETWEALEKAVAAHVNDCADGNLVTDWVLLTASVGVDMRLTTYIDACSDNTPSHSLEGLLQRGLRRISQRGMDDDG